MAVARYSRVAMALHWAIALCIIAMVPMGWWMADAIKDPDSQQTAYRVFQIHKSLGLTILALTLARLAWRVSHRQPPLPAGTKPWEAFLAKAVHAAFYALLIALPLSGWIYVSTGWSVPTDRPLEVATSFFGLFPVPHMPWVAASAEAARRSLAYHAIGAHELMAWGAVVLFVLHVAAALKHQFMDRDGVLASMVPWLETRSGVAGAAERSKAPLAAAAGIALAAVLALAGAVEEAPGPAKPAEKVAAAAVDPIDTAIVPGTASEWAIDQADSKIEFLGNHAGNDFTGRFDDWEGHVWFDPQNLAGSRATVLVRTASAHTGDATQEGSLQLEEWFDVEQFPVARFDADSFRSLGGGRFEAQGTLAIKQAKVPVLLPFTFTRNGDDAKVEGHLELDRTALDLGMASDPGADWVSRVIQVRIAVSAHKK